MTTNDLMALSRERIADELLKLLAVDDPAPTVDVMLQHSILTPVLPEIELGAAATLQALVDAETPSGERRSRMAGVVSLARWGALRSLGARRGWKAKAVPITLTLLAIAPAIIVLGVRALFAEQSGIDLTDALGRETIATSDGVAFTAGIMDELLRRRTVGGRPSDLSDDLAWVRAASGRAPHGDPRLPLIG